ncbi:MAG: helix-turn-helix domain-containing protein [Ilumatobacteraceae bacterium]
MRDDAAAIRPLLTSRQVAELVQVPPRTLDAWAYRGIGPKHLRIGKHRRYQPADVEAWIAENAAQVAASR